MLIKILGPSDRLVKPPTGVTIGRDFNSEPAHIWINIAPSDDPADHTEPRKLPAYVPIDVSDAELEVLSHAGIEVEEVSP